MSTVGWVLLILILVLLFGGGYGIHAGWNTGGIGVVGILVIILLILLVTGRL